MAEIVDVLIVGAGISGVDAAYHLTKMSPDLTYAIVDALEDFGGTWRTHQYPGVRSDSDLYTFGYSFKPWLGDPIAKGERILGYVEEVIDDNGIRPHIRFRHRVHSASWSSERQRWTVVVADEARDTEVTFDVSFLWMCQGYYRHEEGFTPEWPGMADFAGRIVHPQTWPADDSFVDGKNVVIIGSGATAATMVPALAERAAHVTMLQRSPTYFYVGENKDELADQLRALDIDEAWIHEIVRRSRLKQQGEVVELSRTYPDLVRDELLRMVTAELPEGFDVATHFTPKYRPWQQRLALVPEGDLFRAVREGKASVVTDTIETFTPEGIRVSSGDVVPADVVVTATGFNLLVLGGVAFDIDGEPLDIAKTVTYRGMMFTGVPNMCWIFGYFRASWTLRADIVCEFTCRILNHMHEHQYGEVVPRLRPEDLEDEWLDWVNEENFNPSYLVRSLDQMPKRLDKPEWEHSQDYWREKALFESVTPDDDCLQYR